MNGSADLRVLWLVGATALIFGGIGILGAGSIVALPLFLAVLGGLSEGTAFAIFLYFSVIWAPIGFGIGSLGAVALIRGFMRNPQPGGERVPEGS